MFGTSWQARWKNCTLVFLWLNAIAWTKWQHKYKLDLCHQESAKWLCAFQKNLIHTYTCPKQKVVLFKGCTCRFMEQTFHSNSKNFLAWAVCFPNTFSGPKFIQIHVTILNFWRKSSQEYHHVVWKKDNKLKAKKVHHFLI